MTTRNPVVIVTGGTRGIGKCIVERLHRDGYSIVFTHSNSAKDALVVEQALAGSSTLTRGVQIDVADPDCARILFDEAETLGEVTGLVNNAGVTGKLGSLIALTDQDLERVIAINLMATIRLCREAAKRWTQRSDQARRSIINISSVAARTGSPGEYVVYAATKAAVETLSIGLAKELAGDGIFVNAVSPGTVDTTIHALAGEPERAFRVAKKIPLQRPGRPQEIANAVAWLMSSESSYVTGSVMNVAGGL